MYGNAAEATKAALDMWAEKDATIQNQVKPWVIHYSGDKWAPTLVEHEQKLIEQLDRNPSVKEAWRITPKRQDGDGSWVFETHNMLRPLRTRRLLASIK